MADANQGLTPARIWSKPGVKLDGTDFEGDYYTDALWCRFDVTGNGLPRKMWGCQSKTQYVTETPRGLDLYPHGGQNYIHIGEADYLEVMTISNTGSPSAVNDRTPTSGFTASANNLWQFDQMFNSVTQQTVLLAHPGQNLADIDSSATSPVFLGDAADISTPLVEIVGSDVSGGACAIGPFMFYYGSDGFIGWSNANNPISISVGGSSLANTTNVTGQKVIKGLPIRGGVGNAPAGLFWSLDSVLLASYTGGTTAIFDIDYLSHSSTILSAASVVEVDGVFYWVGTNRFLMFNGVVQELENFLNKNDFFDNLNMMWRGKVFGFNNPRWGEIWWCYPRGTSTECNYAIIYNYRLSRLVGYPVWYSTALPANRSSAVSPLVYPFPILGGTDADASTGKYKLWQHETGLDVVDGSSVPQTIQSYFQTSTVAPTVLENVNLPKGLNLQMVAPDFVQAGSMRMTVSGRNTARGPIISLPSLDFPATVTSANPQEQFLYPKGTLNQMRFMFESNTLGGDYQMGQPLAYFRISDGRNIT